MIENLRMKRFFIYDPSRRKIRMGRIMWESRGGPSKGGYSAKLSLALAPKLFAFERKMFEARIALLGIELHIQRSYGGIQT